ncbi:hypothetical protein SNEBB_008061 [Seison nebaliae]|nr:hypothetical protein SNEBB_008061 [Seison nebaliae]
MNQLLFLQDKNLCNGQYYDEKNDHLARPSIPISPTVYPQLFPLHFNSTTSFDTNQIFQSNNSFTHEMNDNPPTIHSERTVENISNIHSSKMIVTESKKYPWPKQNHRNFKHENSFDMDTSSNDSGCSPQTESISSTSPTPQQVSLPINANTLMENNDDNVNRINFSQIIQQIKRQKELEEQNMKEKFFSILNQNSTLTNSQHVKQIYQIYEFLKQLNNHQQLQQNQSQTNHNIANDQPSDHSGIGTSPNENGKNVNENFSPDEERKKCTTNGKRKILKNSRKRKTAGENGEVATDQLKNYRGWRRKVFIEQIVQKKLEKEMLELYDLG